MIIEGIHIEIPIHKIKNKEKINKSLFLIYSKAEIQIVNLKNIKV